MRSLLAFFFFLYCGPLFAIVNTESLRLKLSSKPRHFELGISGDKKQGNSDVEKLTVEFGWGLKAEQREHLFVYNYGFGKSSGVVNTQRSFLHYRMGFLHTEFRATEFFAQIESDKFKDLNLRSLGGVGERFSIFQTDKLKNNLGLGAFYSEEIIESGGQKTTFHQGRFNFYYSLAYKIDEVSTFENVVYFQPVVDYLSDYRIYFDSSLSFKIYEDFQFQMGYQLSHDSIPPEGIKKQDHVYRTKFILSF